MNLRSHVYQLPIDGARIARFRLRAIRYFSIATAMPPREECHRHKRNVSIALIAYLAQIQPRIGIWCGVEKLRSPQSHRRKSDCKGNLADQHPTGLTHSMRARMSRSLSVTGITFLQAKKIPLNGGLRCAAVSGQIRSAPTLCGSATMTGTTGSTGQTGAAYHVG